jgi:hypothetical protein
MHSLVTSCRYPSSNRGGEGNADRSMIGMEDMEIPSRLLLLKDITRLCGCCWTKEWMLNDLPYLPSQNLSWICYIIPWYDGVLVW